jgi:Amt family ammonium transporter
MSGIWIGLIAGIVCYLALSIKGALRLDDSLDVIAVHLVGGLVGTLAVGLFADAAVNSVITEEGIFYGGSGELLKDQAVAAIGVMLFSGIVTYVIALAIETTIGLRVTVDDELTGLDQSQHAESAYAA